MRCIGVAKANSGFTMLELLVVLVILAILGALGIPSFLASVRREQLTASSRSVVSWLEEARNEAMKNMVSCEVSLKLGENETGHLDVKSTSPGCREQLPLVIGESDPGHTRVKANDKGQDNVELLFSPRGTTSNTHEWVLTRDEMPGARCIRIASPLGMIRLGTLTAGKCDYSQAL